MRIASAIVFLPAVILMLRSGGWWSAALIGAASAVSTAEYYLITQGRLKGAAIVGIATSAAMPTFPVWSLERAADAILWTVVVFFLFAWSYQLIRGELADAMVTVAHLLTGLFYGALGLSALSFLRVQPDGMQWVFCVLIVTWGNDTVAYFAGRFLGRRKLYPKISPHKTWEGLLGGMAGSIAGMLISRATFFPELTFGDCLVVGVAAGVVGPLGDLCESMLKRTYQVKDSGAIIPGHGGLLDRIDALLFNAPVTFLYVHFLRGAH